MLKPLKHTLHLDAVPYSQWEREQHNKENHIYIPDWLQNESNSTLLVGTVRNEIDTDIPGISDIIRPGTVLLFEAHTSAPISGQEPMEPGEYVTRLGGPWGERGVLAILEA